MKKRNKETLRFTVECEMRARWAPHFISMIRHMQSLGSMGSSRNVTIFADGDGDFRPKFKFKKQFPWSKQLPSPAKPIKNEDGNVTFDAG